MKRIYKYQILFIFIFLSACVLQKDKKGFLHAEGQKIIDAKGNNVLLRGMGLGGWMLQEGYMLETSRFAGSQHQIKKSIEDLVGPEALDAFYDEWLNNYCTKADIDSMAVWGFNSIRLPMHYNLFTLPIEDEPIVGNDTWLNRGFAMVDELLLWCADNEIYLILDLHAAPGGQGKDANISDYDPSKPSLWESEENQRKTYALWKKLAERYKDEPWLGAYDIINEPNWDFDETGDKNGCKCTENQMLWDFYSNAINAIREVDKNHIVIIEGNCWGNNYKSMPDPNSFDDNLVISFHKYWNYNRQEEIQWVVDMREKYNVPIWLGESGENSNTWFTNAISLLEQNNIGWAWWPYKKINSVTGTVTIPKTEGYQNLLHYWRGKGEKPAIEQARTWLIEQAEMMKIQNCTIHYDVIDAMFRQAQGDKTNYPFKKHILPGLIYASDYDLGANGFAYFDTDTANYRTSGRSSGWNNGRRYRNDGVDIAVCTADITNGYYVGWTEKSEWLNYTVEFRETGLYKLDIMYSAENAGSKMQLNIDGKPKGEIIVFPSTNGIEKWLPIKVNNIEIEEGMHQIRIVVEEGGFNLNSLTFTLNQ